MSMNINSGRSKDYFTTILFYGSRSIKMESVWRCGIRKWLQQQLEGLDSKYITKIASCQLQHLDENKGVTTLLTMSWCICQMPTTLGACPQLLMDLNQVKERWCNMHASRWILRMRLKWHNSLTTALNVNIKLTITVKLLFIVYNHCHGE